MSSLAVQMSITLGMATAYAQEPSYPQRAVRLLIGQSPGGASDTVGRTVAQKLGELLGHPVLVDNRPGASGGIASDIVTRALPDGYTMLLGGPSLIINSILSKRPAQPGKDYEPITQLAQSPNVWLVHPTHPARTMKELIEFARTRPGEVDYASSGLGSPQHLAGELLNVVAGIQMVHIPYSGGGPALVDLLGGRVRVMSSTLPSAVGHIKSGKVRALAVTSARRSSSMPELPTVAEAAALPNYEVSTWQGLLFPGGTARAMVDRVQAESAKALASAEVSARLRDLGYEPVGSTPTQFVAHIKVELAKWPKVIAVAGLKPE
ncbi:MAG: tripartite tricarboxylate transporter substrate binding protein [Proteobacteria bacterium]|nr:tripartite tricarboxylate transporter substrate binding protein [Burkholderiales bacterium]